MRRPQLKISHNPKKHCHLCNREVYNTAHTPNSYWCDWYGTELEPICVDCYKKRLGT